MYRTEVQRSLQSLEQIPEEALEQKFRSASRADVKLACALCSLRSGSLREPYRSYLLSRVQPAVTELIYAENPAALALLDSCGIYTPQRTDEFLKTATDCGAQECAVWLLQLKARRFGFSDRDFTL